MPSFSDWRLAVVSLANANSLATCLRRARKRPFCRSRGCANDNSLQAFFALFRRLGDERFLPGFFEEDLRAELFFTEGGDLLELDFFAGVFPAAFVTFFFATRIVVLFELKST